MMKIGLTSKEIEKTTSTDTVDWQRELAWQIAKLREHYAAQHPYFVPKSNIAGQDQIG